MLVPAAPRRTGLLALPVVAVVVLVVTVVAEATTTPSADGALIAPDPSWVFALVGLAWSVAATVVLDRATRRGGATLVTALLAAGWVVGGVLHLAVRLGAESAPLLLVAEVVSFPLVAVSVPLLLWFPTGRLLPGAWGVFSVVIAWLFVATAVVLVPLRLALGVTGNVVIPRGVPAADVTEWQWWTDAAQPHLSLLINLSYVPAVLVAVVLVVRYRRTAGIERDRVRWLFWCGLVVAFATIGWRLLFDPGQLSVAGLVFNEIAFPVAIVLATLNPSWVSIEDLLSRTLVYGGLSITIIAIDLGVLAALTALLGQRVNDKQVVLLVLLLSAVLYNPLRAWLWALVRRLVLGERNDRYDVVAGLASSLEATDESSEQLTAVAKAVAGAFGIGYVSVEVARESGRRSVATYGVRPAATRELPIAYRGEPVGVLVLPARGIRTRLSQRDQRLLGDLVRQAATAARTGRLADELQRNRQRLVVAREEERRRIRHELHEDLGPTLGGLVHQVESARLLVREQPTVAKQTITRTSEQLRAVVADVRRVVHDLRPPALDDRGLVGALRQQAELGSTETLDITVTGERLEGLPAAVEVAAFRTVGQALSDVRADRSATRCEIAFRRDERELEVTIVTDADVDPESLRARAAELGGRVERAADAVLVRLPIRGGVA